MKRNSMKKNYIPLMFTDVSIEDEFWVPRIRVNRECTIPLAYQQCRNTGRIDAFRLNWKPGLEPIPHIFWDSDVAKWIEAASYSLAAFPDSNLEALLDEVIALIVSAQQTDGYLNTHFTVVEPEKRWTNLRDCHELYCAGHLIEAAVAYFQATGKRTLLDTLCHYADHINRVFGPRPGQKRGYCGHEEIELALVKLYHATGEIRYLELSRYFVDERGRQPYYFDLEANARGDDPSKFWGKTYAYMQAHVPVREQHKVVGHAVRAMYLYSALADLAGETGDRCLLTTCEQLWLHLCTRNMYITGGIGSSRHNEGFTADYELPNETAYAETCAAVGFVFWNHRMLQLECDSRYADEMERALYNGVLSGVSLDGERFFYENPLASQGNHHRQPWFDCACCPPNVARLIASLGQYVYAQNERELVVHLYVQGFGRFEIGGQKVKLRQETHYPWEGAVTIHLEMDRPMTFGLKCRVPGWCRSAHLSVNGEPIEITPLLERGYIRLERTWQPADQVELELAMPIERIYAHPDVRQNVGHVALQRGPLIYCLEEVDHSLPLHQIILPHETQLSRQFDANLLGGVAVITGEVLAADISDWNNILYRAQCTALKPCLLTAIPYYAWDNRQSGQMRVWLPFQ